MATHTQCLLQEASDVDSTSKTSQCPLASFKLPQMFKNHPGGQEHLKTAKEADFPGLMFLAYHIGCDMDGLISRSAKSLGVSLPERGQFYNDVHKLVRQVQEKHKSQHYIFMVWCMMITLALPPTYFWFMYQPCLLGSVTVAFTFVFYFLNIFHTRHHKGGKLYNNEILDGITAPFYDFMDNTWGYNIEAWKENHHVKHHMQTNTLEVDPDVPGAFPSIRTSTEQPKFWFHKYQTFYFLIWLPFSTAYYPIANVTKHGGSRLLFVIWLQVMYIIPYALHGVYGLLNGMLIMGISGFFITYNFAVSHAHPQLREEGCAVEVSPNLQEMSVDDWLKFQIQESTSWGGYMSCLILGGINLQIEHHVAPALDPPLLAFLAPELKRLCAKYKVPYVSEPTLLHAGMSFHHHLWMMG